MPATYFPVEYFSYSIYGVSTGGTSGGGSTGSGGTTGGNKLMSMLQNIAMGLGTAISANQVRVYANDTFPGSALFPDTVVVEVHPSAVVSRPVYSSTSVLASMKYEVRITVRAWPVNKTEMVMNIMTLATTAMSGNTFAGTCIASRSRVERMSVHEVSTGVYEISASGGAEQVL